MNTVVGCAHAQANSLLCVWACNVNRMNVGTGISWQDDYHTTLEKYSFALSRLSSNCRKCLVAIVLKIEAENSLNFPSSVTSNESKEITVHVYC